VSTQRRRHGYAFTLRQAPILQLLLKSGAAIGYEDLKGLTSTRRTSG